MGTDDALLRANQDVKVSVPARLAADEQVDRPTSGDPPPRLALAEQLAGVPGDSGLPRSKVLCGHPRTAPQALALDPFVSVPELRSWVSSPASPGGSAHRHLPLSRCSELWSSAGRARERALSLAPPPLPVPSTSS